MDWLIQDIINTIWPSAGGASPALRSDYSFASATAIFAAARALL